MRALSEVVPRSSSAVGSGDVKQEERCTAGNWWLICGPSYNLRRLQYEALSRVGLKPGRYEVRVGARHRQAGRQGTVRTYVEVPDFAREPVSLSGIVLHDPGAAHVTPASVLGGVLSHAPTTRREFAADDVLTALVRVYQHERGLSRVRLSMRVTDAGSHSVHHDTRTLEPAAFGPDRSTDASFVLPIDRLAAGEYLLTIEARRNASTARRDVRVRVR